MKLTVLDAVQSYLNAVNGFRVDSIHETDEAYQAALICKETYQMLFQHVNDLQFASSLVTLDDLLDVDKPTHLRIKQAVNKIHLSKIQYIRDLDNNVYCDVQYINPVEFLDLTKYRSSTEANTQVVLENGAKFTVYTNRQPQYWTSFDDDYIVFDSWDASESTTVVASRTRMYASVEQDFILDDDFIIPVPSHLSSVFLDIFRDEAALLMRNEVLPRVAQRARAGRIKLQQDHRRTGSMGSSKIKYGRH